MKTLWGLAAFLPGLFQADTLPLLKILCLQDISFKQSAASTYTTLRGGPWSDSSITAILDGVKAQLQQPGLRTSTGVHMLVHTSC